MLVMQPLLERLTEIAIFPRVRPDSRWPIASAAFSNG